MARIRSIKPEVRRSLTVAQWPREVRLAWIYLWNYLDDEGRGIDDMRLVVAELFPVDRDVTEKKMDGWLNLMAITKSLDDDLPPLCRYEVAGQRYMHALKWRHHQRINRPSPSRIPPCPIHESSVKPHGTFSESFTERSLPDSPHSRAPEEQGAGSRERSQEQGAREQGSTNTHTPSAQLVDQHVHELPSAIRGRLATVVSTLTVEGVPTPTIEAGLVAWSRRPGAAPGLLPFLVADLQLDDRLPKKPALTVNGSAPPWCGDCDQHNRWEDTGDGWRRCPRCHPLTASAAATPSEATAPPTHGGALAMTGHPDDPPF